MRDANDEGPVSPTVARLWKVMRLAAARSRWHGQGLYQAVWDWNGYACGVTLADEPTWFVETNGWPPPVPPREGQ